MASAVATPLEKQFSTIAGIDSMTSVSTSGQTTVTLQFALDRSIDAAAQDVQSAIAAAARSLPSTLPTPPTQRKVNPADFPILNLALTSDTQPLSVVDDYAENLLAQRISTISGVAQVQVYGAQQYAVRIQLDPNALATRGIALTEVEQAVGNANVNLPTGTLYGRDRNFTVYAENGQLYSAAEFGPLQVAYRNGRAVRLGICEATHADHGLDSVGNVSGGDDFRSGYGRESGQQRLQDRQRLLIVCERNLKKAKADGRPVGQPG